VPVNTEKREDWTPNKEDWAPKKEKKSPTNSPILLLKIQAKATTLS